MALECFEGCGEDLLEEVEGRDGGPESQGSRVRGRPRGRILAFLCLIGLGWFSMFSGAAGATFPEPGSADGTGERGEPGGSERDPAIAHNERGVRLLEKESYREAIKEFREALKYRPVDPTIRANLASAHLVYGIRKLADKSYESAQEQFEESLNYDPRSASGHYHLAVTLHYRKKIREAARSFEKAIEYRPDFGEAFEGLAQCRYGLGQIAPAIQAMEEAIRLLPSKEPLRERLDKFKREQSVEQKFIGQQSARFEIRFDGDREDPSFVREVLHQLEEAYTKVGADFGYYSETRIPVILYSDREFSHVTGSQSWMGGVYDGKIRLPTKNFANNLPGLRKVVIHEYTHVVINQICPRTPAWIHEGLAQFQEGKSIDLARKELRDAAAAGAEISLTELPSATFTGLRDPLKARRAYALSLVATKELLDLVGYTGVRRLLLLLKENDDLAEAFERVVGRTLADFDADLGFSLED